MLNTDEEDSELEHESSNDEHIDLIFTENLDKMTREQVEKRDQVKMQVAETLKKY